MTFSQMELFLELFLVISGRKKISSGSYDWSFSTLRELSSQLISWYFVLWSYCDFFSCYFLNFWSLLTRGAASLLAVHVPKVRWVWARSHPRTRLDEPIAASY